MESLFGRGAVFIFFTLYFSLILQILPMGEILSYLRPSWVLLAVLFWTRVIPGRFGLSTVLVTGLLMDVLLDTVLGLHAISLLLVVYLQLLFHKQIKVFSTAQQVLLIFVFSLLYLMIFRLVSAFFEQTLNVGFAYWLPALVNAVLWPWLFIVLDSLKLRYSIYESN